MYEARTNGHFMKCLICFYDCRMTWLPVRRGRQTGAAGQTGTSDRGLHSRLTSSSDEFHGLRLTVPGLTGVAMSPRLTSSSDGDQGTQLSSFKVARKLTTSRISLFDRTFFISGMLDGEFCLLAIWLFCIACAG